MNRNSVLNLVAKIYSISGRRVSLGRKSCWMMEMGEYLRKYWVLYVRSCCPFQIVTVIRCCYLFLFAVIYVCKVPVIDVVSLYLFQFVVYLRRCYQEKKPSVTPVSSSDIFHDTPVHSPDPHVNSGGNTSIGDSRWTTGGEGYHLWVRKKWWWWWVLTPLHTMDKSVLSYANLYNIKDCWVWGQIYHTLVVFFKIESS